MCEKFNKLFWSKHGHNSVLVLYIIWKMYIKIWCHSSEILQSVLKTAWSVFSVLCKFGCCKIFLQDSQIKISNNLDNINKFGKNQCINYKVLLKIFTFLGCHSFTTNLCISKWRLDSTQQKSLVIIYIHNVIICIHNIIIYIHNNIHI